MRRSLTGILFLLTSTSAALAANQSPLEPALALDAWRSSHGERWAARPDAFGAVELLYGGTASFGATPRNDEEWVALAQRAIDESRVLHGIDVATLVPERALLLPLGQVGSGDKWSVRLRQSFGGIEVAGASVNALFDARGALLALQTHALSDFDGVALTPTVTAEAARDIAVAAFAKHAGQPAALVSNPELRIAMVEQDGRRYGRLVWQVDVQTDPSVGDAAGFLYSIDALAGYPIAREPSVHYFDISGTISTRATPGVLPDTASNPTTTQGAKYIRIQNGTVNTVTDANGNFVIAGVSTAQNVTLTYSGPFTTVDDNGAAGFSQVVTLNPGAGNLVTLNAAPTEFVTSQANIFNSVATVRDYVRRINPADATADAPYTGHANIPSSCNAFYNGDINFYAQSASCVNTAYSTVIAHEEGHGLNVRYGTGNGGDGMGEGNGDVWALYVYDYPINGEDFFLSGGDIRTGTNTRQFCGDCSPGCYGEVHADGEVWMGAAWKVRVNLNTSLGNTLGDLTADNLFLGWMNGFDQTQIRSVIELQWLLLDDNDANLGNGTPHGTDIMNGFRVQGFPGYFIEISGTSAIADQSCEAGSYAVSANIVPVQGQTITSATLTYQVEAGPSIAVPMANTGGTTWSGNIPYVASPAHVSYNVSATDNGGHSKAAFCASRQFFIGAVNAFATENFDAGNDAGWTHASIGGPPNANDDWQRGTPAGRTGTSQGVAWTDPLGAVSATGAWGNDLGGSGFNGAYQANVHSALVSPAFNCTGRTNVQLIFKRWLTVEEAIYDHATISVNGTPVWSNQLNGHTLDTSWTTQVVDISAVADNNPSVVLQFELQSDGGLELGGWQIDDVQLGQLVAAPACGALTNFCSGDGSLQTPCPCGNRGASGRGCANSVNAQGARLLATGNPSPDTLVLTASGMPNVASVSAIFLQGDAITPAGIVFGDGLRCIDGTLVRLGSKPFATGTAIYPEAGDASVSVRGGVTPGSGVSRSYQTFYRNAATAFCPPATFNVTSAVRVIW